MIDTENKERKSTMTDVYVYFKTRRIIMVNQKQVAKEFKILFFENSMWKGKDSTTQIEDHKSDSVWMETNHFLYEKGYELIAEKLKIPFSSASDFQFNFNDELLGKSIIVVLDEQLNVQTATINKSA